MPEAKAQHRQRSRKITTIKHPFQPACPTPPITIMPPHRVPIEASSASVSSTDAAGRLWNDERGFIVSIELILVVTIVVIGLIAGLTALRDAIVSELTDVAQSVQQVNQSHSINGVTGHAASTAGSDFVDRSEPDNCTAMFGVIDEI